MFFLVIFNKSKSLVFRTLDSDPYKKFHVFTFPYPQLVFNENNSTKLLVVTRNGRYMEKKERKKKKKVDVF